MANLKRYLLLFFGLLILVFGYLFYGLRTDTKSPEISLNSFSPYGLLSGKVIAASCGYSNAGHKAEDSTACTTTIMCAGVAIIKTGTSLCGGGCTPTDTTCPSCPNGATNPPLCNMCVPGTTYITDKCVCNNGASDAPTCVRCGTNMTLYNNLCQCSNGATNPPACDQCPAGSNMTNGQCTCSNGATPQSNCTQCPAGQIFKNGQCVPTCPMTNVCGQSIQGIRVNNVCTTYDGSNPNASCIQNFVVNTNTVNPNGSVEFSWSIPTVDGVTSRCGFVDLTTPTPRLIPGLQNLDPNVDTARISNIQATTRFCLICQFFNTNSSGCDFSTLNGCTSLGQAQAHQWVRVVRIGEN